MTKDALYKYAINKQFQLETDLHKYSSRLSYKTAEWKMNLFLKGKKDPVLTERKNKV
jgi:hypothetical protein